MRGRRRLSRRAKLAVFALLALLLLGGAGTAVALKVKHDNDVKAERDRKAAEAARIAEERQDAEDAAAAERKREREAQEAQEALDEIELEGRRDLERSLRKSIMKDAREQVTLGLLDGPVLKTVCDPVGGGRDDLSSRTGKYECLAVTEIDESDGTSRGYSYHATINYKEYSWTWGLGRE
jgi:hypothetical protein